jgi:ABC-type lipoprotein release transport system permease subunit
MQEHLGFALLQGAMAATRVLGTFLVDVSPTDPATFLSVSVLFTCVALLASSLSSRHAAAVEPMRALRSE